MIFIVFGWSGIAFALGYFLGRWREKKWSLGEDRHTKEVVGADEQQTVHRDGF